MKRFEFKLQPVLNFRKYQERIAQQQTAKAQMDLKNCEKNIIHLEQAYEQSADQIEKNVMNGIGAFEFRQYHQYLDSVEGTIEDEKKRKIKLKKKLEEKLQVLKRKSVEKKAMELHREKLKTIYNEEFIKIEQKESDEMSSLKTARKLSNETV